MIVHRCDVCSIELAPDQTRGGSLSPLTTVVLRFNLEGLAKPDIAINEGGVAAGPNYVQGTMDLCTSIQCRREGIRQITERICEAALRKSGISLKLTEEKK